MDDLYDLAMTFCRVQEFYESPYKNIRNKYFTLVEFMDTYTKNRDCPSFTYPADWVGYNIPSKIIEKLYYSKTNHIEDENIYDEMIKNMDSFIVNDQGKDTKYYLIGSVSGDEVTLAHETVHAFYNLNSAYRKAVNFIIDNDLKASTLKALSNTLSNLGYTSHVFKDEINAYLCTNDDVISFGLSMAQKINFNKVRNKLNSLYNDIKKSS